VCARFFASILAISTACTVFCVDSIYCL
jgi:hypothetical protein